VARSRGRSWSHTGRDLPLADYQFDLAMANAVIKHVGDAANQRKFVTEQARVVARDWVITTHRTDGSGGVTHVGGAAALVPGVATAADGVHSPVIATGVRRATSRRRPDRRPRLVGGRHRFLQPWLATAGDRRAVGRSQPYRGGPLAFNKDEARFNRYLRDRGIKDT